MRKTLEAIGIAFLALLAWITWSALNGPNPLPQRIPTHFNAMGEPNAWGSPATLWLLPAVAAFVFLLISVVSMFPAAFNFPVRSTPMNRPRLVALTLQMMAWVKVELVSLFLYIQWSIIESVRQVHAALSPVIVPLFLVAVFVTLAAHGVAVFRAARAGAY
ncbi:MAG: DUF1648 domain-containing protein [Terracidiphilus sp.]